MTHPGLLEAVARMADARVNSATVKVFSRYFEQLAEGASGILREADVLPLTDPAQFPSTEPTLEDIDAFSRTAIIRLNGGLGTSMGLATAKALIPVWQGHSFLDIIARQVWYARRTYQVRLPVLFLHSAVTRADCMAGLAGYDLNVGDLPLDMEQSQVPRLRADSLYPLDWPANPSLQWCPPGHGDIYPTLLTSGVLEQLIGAGFDYASISNSDNLGCSPDPALAGWFARSGAPYAAEVTLRTPMDLKGGHIVRRRSDGQLVLRETAQTAAEDMQHFTDASKHPYTHTNNLWFDLRALRARLIENDGVLGLPLIRNVKRTDQTDPDSPEVIQLESAMGAAIQVFEGATAVAVPRARFLPVKTTNELTLLRSDVYSWDDTWVPRAVVDPLPVVSLSSLYRHLDAFEQRLPSPLGLREARSLTVNGDWSFGSAVRVFGEVVLDDCGGRVADATVLGCATD